MKKIYYQLVFEQNSPLRIGNGHHEESDSDLMLDGRGIPFIPGTSLAGVFRHKAIENEIDEEIENRLFGFVKTSGSKEDKKNAESSAIIFSDAVLAKEDVNSKLSLGRRDGVGLSAWGTAKKLAKFDFQIAETTSKFYSVIEWSGDDAQYKSEIEEVIEPILKHYIATGIKVGARTSRGYGSMDIEVRKKVFDFPDNLDMWLDFEPFVIEAFAEAELLEGEIGKSDAKIEIGFHMTGPFSVRVNTAKTELAEDGSIPDSVPMENIYGNPIIPGTAWAGCFRHHMHDLLRDVGVEEGSSEMKKVDELFGYDDNASNIKKSVFTFSETEVVVDNKQLQKTSVMRTAIDRFTASPKNGALFTSMVYTGGTGKLYISFDRRKVNEKHLELLAACICDLHLGFMSLGGEASIGRGLMQVDKVSYNGADKTAKMYETIDKEEPLNWLKEE